MKIISVSVTNCSMKRSRSKRVGILKRTSLLLCLVFLTACTSVPISTMWKLRNFNPLEADPGAIRIAVISNKIVQLKDGSVSIELGFSSEYSEHNFKSASKATVKTNSNIKQLRSSMTEDQRITLFYLDDEAAHTMRLAQNRIKVIRENDIQGDGSLGVTIDTGCFSAPKPEKLLATIYAKFAPDQAYIKMASNIDLLKQTEAEQNDFWFQCPPTSSPLATD